MTNEKARALADVIGLALNCLGCGAIMACAVLSIALIVGAIP